VPAVHSAAGVRQMNGMDIIYARQSIDKKDSLSIEGQIELCRRFAGEAAVVYQDRGFSGKNTKRPAFTEVMRCVESGQVGKLYVYRLDRFSRSIADFSRVWEVLSENGVEFASVTEHFDTSTPIGRAMLNIVLVFAQLERETIAQRVRDNYRHRFSLGAWPGGPAPYGFDLTKIEDGGRTVSSLTANGNAEVVKQMFQEYAEPGVSLRSLAKSLTDRGIHGPKRDAWDNVTLSRILRSPLYVRADETVYWHYLTQGLRIDLPPEAFDGVHACNVIGRRDRSRDKYHSPEQQCLTVANHEGIVEPDLWLRVQEKLAKNAQLPRTNAGKYSWLTGLLKCAKCGYAVKINHVKSTDTYKLICSGRSNFSNCDGEIRIDLRELEDAVAKQIQTFFSAYREETPLPPDEETAAELLRIEGQIDRLIQALSESSEISAAYISQEIDRLHTRREALVNQPRRTANQGRTLDFHALTPEEKKLVAAEFIDRILLCGDEAEIIWNV